MRYATIVSTVLLMAWLVGAGVLAQQAAPPPTVTLDRSVHFTSPEGNDVEAPAGTYHVEPERESRLRLSASDGGVAFLIQAQSTTHTEALELPIALIVATDEDTSHVVLLMPDHTALDAPASTRAVRSRAALSPLPAPHIKQAYSSQLAKADALRQSARPMAVPQDMNIFATPIMEVPIPLATTPKPGSYQASCQNMSQVQRKRVGAGWTMTTLSAQCRTIQGSLVAASLKDPQLCAGDIANNNGVLQCQRAIPTVLGRPIFALPGGSWQQTCRDAYYHMDSREVRAQCRTISGEWRDTSLNTSYACPSVSNDNGWMSCDTAPLPRGPWRGYCKEASLPMPGIGFSAICMRPSDFVWQRTMVGPCTKDVDALDGHLTCGLITGLPEGNWVGRCRPVNWDAAEPAITLVCTNTDQTQAAYRVPLSTCPSPVKLFYDGSGRYGFLC
jgi:hypothetical protein